MELSHSCRDVAPRDVGSRHGEGGIRLTELRGFCQPSWFIKWSFESRSQQCVPWVMRLNWEFGHSYGLREQAFLTLRCHRRCYRLNKGLCFSTAEV